MSKYILVAGDIVDFTDPMSGKVHRGFIDQYAKGRPHNRDYSVKFDTPWHGFDKAWCSAEDLELVRSTRASHTVTFSTNQASNPLGSYDPKNIKINQAGTTTTSTQTFTTQVKSEEPNYPWSPYYITSDDFFDILRVAFDDTYGSDHRWHPEDLYINVSSVLEVVSNTLTNMVRIKAGRELSGVKNP